MLSGPGEIRRALQLVGELLEANGSRFDIVVVGGSALNLLGIISRATTDVDVLALAERTRGGPTVLSRPGATLPAPLVGAARIVARDLGLDPHWLNTGPEAQWDSGLPPGLDSRITWETFGLLSVGLVGRRDLIFLKVYAAADDIGPGSVHFQDLVALVPTDGELTEAAAWVQSQDPSLDFGRIVAEVVKHARRARSNPR